MKSLKIRARVDRERIDPPKTKINKEKSGTLRKEIRVREERPAHHVRGRGEVGKEAAEETSSGQWAELPFVASFKTHVKSGFYGD